jgi:hypothetical protein
MAKCSYQKLHQTLKTMEKDTNELKKGFGTNGNIMSLQLPLSGDTHQ